MRSIDNLREYALTAASICSTTRAVLAGYIDGIERDVAELTDERDLLKTQWEAGVDFDQRLEACADNREDVTLWGVDYTALPVDADGVPIRIGDVMENIVCPPVHREVTGVGVECFYGWDDGNGRYSQFGANCYRHHHAPTVEDVLREFAQEMNENLGMYTGEAIDADEWRKADERTIAEYAAKLRLAGGE